MLELLPADWIGCECLLSYDSGVGEEPVREKRGVLLDWFAAGPVFDLSGRRVLVSWDRIVELELATE